MDLGEVGSASGVGGQRYFGDGLFSQFISLKLALGRKDGMYAALIRMDGTTAWVWGRGDRDNDLYILGGASHQGGAFTLQGAFGEELDLGSGPLEDTTDGNYANMFVARFERVED